MWEVFSLWASISIWLATMWVAFWQCYFLYKVLEILGKNPKMSSYFMILAILWIALVESSAIYGLIISLQLVSANFTNEFATIWAGLAIWLTGLWVWIWEWMIVNDAAEAINRRPEEKSKIMSFMILFIALVESAAIYWIIVATQIVNAQATITTYAALWAWFAIWITGLWVAIAEWYIAKKAMWAIWEYGLETNKMLIPVTILSIALTESAAIYWLIVSTGILGSENPSIALVWAWLAIWLAWLWVSLWDASLIWRFISKIGLPSWKSLITITILWVALVESAAIYWLIISQSIISQSAALGIAWIWAGLSIWLSGMAVWMAEWYIVSGALSSMVRNPKEKTRYMTFMILFVALVEVLAIYWLIIANAILTQWVK